MRAKRNTIKCARRFGDRRTRNNNMTREPTSQSSGPRRHALIIALVQEFIATAGPVGSAQIVARHNLGVRGAMVRNMMAELEEAGFVEQPHTSSGRVPTEKAFRYYVDNLHPAVRIGFGDRSQLELKLSNIARDPSGVLRETPRILASMTGQAAMAMAPRLETVTVDRVELVRIREREVLSVFVIRSGLPQNRIVATDRDHTQEELDRMARYLNESIAGRNLDQARNWIAARVREDRARYDRFIADALALAGAIAAPPEYPELYVEGGLQALEQPEFADRSRMRELLRALDDKTALLELLDRALAHDGLTVSIGTENRDPRLANLSVVAASYVAGDAALGSLAIVGPLRMDYDRVIPLVAYAARTIGRLMEH
jgi:heat-inducible transcriptional repressor